MRRDLADVRLADRVFASHYAAAVMMVTSRAVALRDKPAHDADVVAMLDADASFEMLERSGGNAWGVAPVLGLVGYVDADALVRP